MNTDVLVKAFIQGVSSIGFAAIALFFIKRYIEKTDDKISLLDSKFQNFSEKIDSFHEKAAELKIEMNKTTSEIKESDYNYTLKIKVEMDSLNKKVDILSGKLSRVELSMSQKEKHYGKIIEFEKGLKKVVGDLDGFKDVVRKHRQKRLAKKKK